MKKIISTPIEQAFDNRSDLDSMLQRLSNFISSCIQVCNDGISQPLLAASSIQVSAKNPTQKEILEIIEAPIAAHPPLAIEIAHTLMLAHKELTTHSDEITKLIKSFPNTHFAIFEVKDGLMWDSVSLGTFPTEGKPYFRHSSDISEQDAPKREAAIQAEFITSVRKQAAMIKTGAEQAVSQLPAHAYTDPVVGRRLLKGLVFGTISKAFTIGTNTLTLDVASQREIVDKLCTDRILQPDGLKALAQNLHVFTDPDVKRFLAYAIHNGKFGNTEEVLTKLRGNLHVFTDTDAQIILRNAISDGSFGNPQEVLTEITQNLSDLTPAWLKSSVIEAIHDGKFINYPEVTKVLVGRLHVFTEPHSQRFLAYAIRNDKFGNNPAVLNVLTQNLKIFTDKHDQRTLTLALRDGNFGKNPHVLTALVQNLSDSTPEWLKSSLVKAILDGKFSDYPEVLKVLIGKLHVFTRKAAQYTLSIAILFQKFGDKTDVLTALAQNLHVFTYTHAQKIVAQTLCAGRLGDPELALKALRQNLLACTDSKARAVLQNIINFTD